MRWRSMLVTAAAIVWLAAPTSASAQTVKDALKLVPKDSLGFILVNNPGQTSVRIGTLAKNVGVPLPLPPGGPLELVKAKLGIDKSLDDKGVAVLAVLPGKGPEPDPILFLPVTDYKDFLKELKVKEGDDGLAVFDPGQGPGVVIGNKGSYAVLVPAPGRAGLKKYLATKGENGALAYLATYLGENDANLVVTPAGIKLIAVKALEGIKEGRGELQNVPPEASKILEIYLEAATALVKGIETNVGAVATGLKLDAEGGIHARARFVFKKGSDYAKLGGEIKAPKGGPLAGLPNEPFVFALGGAVPEKLMAGMTDFGMEVLKLTLKDVPAEKIKKLQDITASSLKGVHGMGFMLGSPRPQGGIMSGLVGVIHVDDAAAYLEAYETAIKASNDLFEGSPIKMVYTLKKAKVGGRPALEVITKFPEDPNAPEEAKAIQKKIMEMVFGPGGHMTATVVAANDTTIVSGYTTPADLKDLLKGTKGKGLAGSEEVAKTLAHLPTGSQWIGLFSPSGMMEFGGKLVALIPGAPQLPAIAKTPPIGYAAKIAPAGLEMDLVITAETIQAIGRLVQDLEKLKNAQ
jgi:hypothetical protein